MQVFEDGYSRLETTDNVLGYEFIPVKILEVPEPINKVSGSKIETVPCVNFQKKKKNTTDTDQNKHNNTKSKTIPDSYDYSNVQTTQSITNVFDSKNQLTSLMKNAKQNENSLRERNERRDQAKQQSKRQYGW
ncbi:hypothetical protein MOUN0_N12112 [Monosporozyma unispora]|nr:hypothetical protein C6P44_003353 [Kazachstania unispora]